MGLNLGIVGLPNVGKSTLFNALTRNDVLAANYPFATIEPNEGVVPLPDPRLDTVLQSQGDIASRFQQTIEAQTQLQNMLAARIDALDKRLGETLTDSATKTAAKKVAASRPARTTVTTAKTGRTKTAPARAAEAGFSPGAKKPGKAAKVGKAAPADPHIRDR